MESPLSKYAAKLLTAIVRKKQGWEGKEQRGGTLVLGKVKKIDCLLLGILSALQVGISLYLRTLKFF